MPHVSNIDANPFVPVGLELPDGTAIHCVTAPEALLLWTELHDDGVYRAGTDQLRRGDAVLDIGANIGLASIVFHRHADGLRVIAVEAAPDTFACLEENLRRHVPDAAALCAAVSDQTGERSFTYYPNAPGNSSLLADRAGDDENTRIFLANSGVDSEFVEDLVHDLHEGVDLVVPTVTVSDLLRRYDLDEVGLLKVDVERAELLVLRGIDDEHWQRIRHITLEVHGRNGGLDEVVGLLTSRGYATTVTQNPKLAGTDLFDVTAQRHD